jgi:hypothetical protein
LLAHSWKIVVWEFGRLDLFVQLVVEIVVVNVD